MTWHLAPYPQTPGQGSTHLVLTQTRLRAQSALITHSGRQPLLDDGDPKKPGRHSHTALSPDVLHLVFGPQGDGIQGSGGKVSSAKHERDSV